MKITDINIKKLISLLGFIPEDGCDNVYIKEYSYYSNYSIRINFNTRKIEYRAENVPEQDGITWGDATTSNFENSENFVVLECVNRLLEKGYAPKSTTLEKKYPLGRNLKGKVDIVVADSEGVSFLMVECKTWGQEYEKEKKKMLKDGAQLFSYYANDRSVKYLCLYASEYTEDDIEYKNAIVPVGEDWIELANVKEIFDHWNKNFKDNGIFESWASAYGIEIKALVRGQLQPLTKDDSGRIFNQFAEILRHNVVSDKPNAFNKILNLFICKIIDEDKNEDEQVDFQWLEDDTDERLQVRLNDLYKKGMHRFLEIDVTDYSDEEITGQLANISDKAALEAIKNMLVKLRLQKNPEFAFIEVYNDQSFRTNARVVREVVELLQPYQFRYGHKQQFLGDFFELLLNTSIKQEYIWQEYGRYPLAKISNFATMIQRGKTVGYGNGSTQVIKSGQARGYSEFDFTQKFFVDNAFVADERNLKKGDILVNSSGVGTAGRVTLFELDGDFVVDSHITIVRIDQHKALPKYVLYALAAIGFKNIEKMASGQSGQIELAATTIADIKIPLPPIDEQKKIVDKIGAVEVLEAGLISNLNDLKRQQDKLFAELSAKSESFVSLADSEKFDISIGKRVLKSELIPGGSVPVYSANVHQVFGKTNQRLLNDFSVPSVIWGIDGDWMVNYIPENEPFYPTDHCGVLRIKVDDINPRYMAKALELAGHKVRFSRSYRASIERIQGIRIPLPPITEQQQIISQIEPIENQILDLEKSIMGLKSERVDVFRKSIK